MEDEKRLLEKLGTIYGPWARLAILTGLRQSEQFRLQWKDGDLERGMLTLLVTKAGGVQYAPLNEEAMAIPRGLESWQCSKWVFPTRSVLPLYNSPTRLRAESAMHHELSPREDHSATILAKSE